MQMGSVHPSQTNQNIKYYASMENVLQNPINISHNVYQSNLQCAAKTILNTLLEHNFDSWLFDITE